MNEVFQRPRASAAGKKVSEVFHRKIALRMGGSDASAAKKKLPVVGHGKISLFDSAVCARFSEPPILKAVMAKRVPIKLFSKEDFSESIGADGKPHREKKG